MKAATRNAVAWKILLLDQKLNGLYEAPHVTRTAAKQEQTILRQRDRMYSRLERWFRKG